MSFSKILRLLRTESNITQKELALKLGFCKNIVCEWEHERCEPSIDALKKIGAFFSVSVDYLIGNSDEMGNISATAAPMGETLTKEESDLLTFFRGMDNVCKEAIMTTAHNFYNLNKNSSAMVR